MQGEEEVIVVTTEPKLEETLRASGRAPDGLEVHYRETASGAMTLARSFMAVGKAPVLALTDSSLRELVDQHMKFYFNYAGCLVPKSVSGNDLAGQLLVGR